MQDSRAKSKATAPPLFSGAAAPLDLGAASISDALKSLKTSENGLWLLEQLFQMDDFEDAPKMGYHALYRLAVASL